MSDDDVVRDWEAVRANTWHRRALGLVLLGPLIGAIPGAILVLTVGRLFALAPIVELASAIPDVGTLQAVVMLGVLAQFASVLLGYLTAWGVYVVGSSALLRLLPARRSSVVALHGGLLAALGLFAGAPALYGLARNLSLSSGVEVRALAWPSPHEPWLVHVAIEGAGDVQLPAPTLVADGARGKHMSWVIGRHTWLTVPAQFGPFDALAVGWTTADGARGHRTVPLEPWTGLELPRRVALPDAELPELTALLPELVQCFDWIRVPATVILRSGRDPLLVVKRSETDERTDAASTCIHELVGAPLGQLEPEEIRVEVTFELPAELRR